jgi:flagellar hook-length control protein FliK
VPASAVPPSNGIESSASSFITASSNPARAAPEAPEGYTRGRIDDAMLDDKFPRILGMKVGQWAQDGIQQVWLDVHPADMGPVAIQIALDGRQAELSFGAASADARQVIESSLPELAAALQSAGLTLSGGSISQQLPQPQDRPEPPAAAPWRQPGSGRSDATTLETLLDPSTRRRTGLVDLYA